MSLLPALEIAASALQLQVSAGSAELPFPTQTDSAVPCVSVFSLRLDCDLISPREIWLQVAEINGQDVVCTAQNDALLEGLLTVIHKEREAEFGMSSIQVRLH